MSYMRDKDHATRGVGAIAARDHAQPRQRAWSQSRMVQATQRRDHAMAMVARGALGLVPAGLAMPSGRIVVEHTSGPRPKSTTVKVTTSGNTTIRDHRHAPGDGPAAPPATPSPAAPPPAPVAAPAPAPAPVAAPPMLTSPAPPAPSGSGTGGGGGNVTVSIPGASPIASPPPPGGLLPDIPDAPDNAAPDNTTRNLMIAGGVAIVAAFLLFRNRGPS